MLACALTSAKQFVRGDGLKDGDPMRVLVCAMLAVCTRGRLCVGGVVDVVGGWMMLSISIFDVGGC